MVGNRKVDFSTQQAIERLRSMSLSDLQAQSRPQSEGYKGKLKTYNNLLYGGRSAYVQIMCDRIKKEFLNSAEPLELIIQGYEDPTPNAKLYWDKQTQRGRRKLIVYDGGKRIHHADGADYPITPKAYNFIVPGTANRRIRGAEGNQFESVELREFELKWLWEYPLKRALKDDYKAKFLDGNHAKEVLGINYGLSKSVLGRSLNPNTEADLQRLINHLLDYFVDTFGEDEVWAPVQPGQKAHRVPILMYAGTIKTIPEGRGAKVKKRYAMRASLLYMQEQEDARFKSYRSKDEESHLPLKAADTYHGRNWNADLDDIDPGDYGDYGDSYLTDLEADGYYQEGGDLAIGINRLRQLTGRAADTENATPALEHPPEWTEGYQPTARQQRSQHQRSVDLEAQATALLAAANGNGTKGKGKGKTNGEVTDAPVLTGTRLFGHPTDAL